METQTHTQTPSPALPLTSETPTGEMAVMGQEGDTKHMWDKAKPAEVEAARALFNTLVKEKKYLAFKCVGKNGDKGDQIRDFDPDAERLIFVPPMQGG